MPRYLIIGAGPTGLGAALHLLAQGEQDFLVVDAATEAGGLASSCRDERGFTWDQGGHVQFSHYELFDKYMDLALGQDGWLHHERESWVWIRDRFVPYPLQYNLHRLPAPDKWRCVQGLLEAGRRSAGRLLNFHDWILGTFGQGVADVFLLPYNFKVWGYPPEQMGFGWVGEQVAVPNLDKVLEGICLEQDQVSWGPNQTFRFPKFGGTGAIWRALAARVPARNLLLGQRVESVDGPSRSLRLTNGEDLHYEFLISTMPVDLLTHLLGRRDLAAAADELLHSSTWIVGIGLDGSPPEHLRTKCWMYFPEANCPFYRVTVFSNYSPYNTPRPGSTWSLMAEVSQSPCKPVRAETLVSDVVSGMRNARLIREDDVILGSWHRVLSYGYPTPSVGRDALLGAIQPELEELGIFSRGRFGAWKYEISNQDHSFMQGVEVVERLMHGRTELTLTSPNLINGRRNLYPYPEWAASQLQPCTA